MCVRILNILSWLFAVSVPSSSLPHATLAVSDAASSDVPPLGADTSKPITAPAAATSPTANFAVVIPARPVAPPTTRIYTRELPRKQLHSTTYELGRRLRRTAVCQPRARTSWVDKIVKSGRWQLFDLKSRSNSASTSICATSRKVDKGLDKFWCWAIGKDAHSLIAANRSTFERMLILSSKLLVFSYNPISSDVLASSIAWSKTSSFLKIASLVCFATDWSCDCRAWCATSFRRQLLSWLSFLATQFCRLNTCSWDMAISSKSSSDSRNRVWFAL